jgi:hypothetical protein
MMQLHIVEIYISQTITPFISNAEMSSVLKMGTVDSNRPW